MAYLWGAKAGEALGSKSDEQAASLTLAIYARQMDRRDGEPERLEALVNGEEWAQQPAPSSGHPVGTRAPGAIEKIPA